MFDVLQAVTLGFLYGLGPCTIACAPLIVPLIMATSKNMKEGVKYSIIFSIGRVISYMSLGFLSGLLGRYVGDIVSNRGLGVLFIVLGIAILFNVQGKCILKTRLKITGPFMSLTSGIIFGLAPCPPLVALLGLAVLSKSALTGGLMGLVFGAGTVISPIIVLGLFSGWFAKHRELKDFIPYTSGIFLILIGLAYMIFS